MNSNVKYTIVWKIEQQQKENCNARMPGDSEVGAENDRTTTEGKRGRRRTGDDRKEIPKYHK